MEIELPDGTILDAPDDADASAVARAYMAKSKPAAASDYDYDGARAAGVGQGQNGHWPDTYKLPNHITFSADSKYSKPGQEGGAWSQVGGKWHYKPSAFVLGQHSPEELKSYFAKSEPDSVLDLAAPAMPVRGDFRDQYAGQGLVQGNLNYLKDYVSGIGKAAMKSPEPDIGTSMPVVGAADAAAHLGSSALAPLFALPDYAITKMGFPDPRNPSGTYAGAREKYTYQPRTSMGKQASELAGAVMKPAGDVFSTIGSGYGDLAGLAGASPQAQNEIRDIAPDVVSAGLTAGALRAPKPGKAPVPTKDELGTQAKAAYKRAEDAGIAVSPESFSAMKMKLLDKLEKEGIDKDLHPKATAALNRVASTEGPVTLEKIETLRRIAKDAESSIDKADRRMAGELIDDLDEYVGNLDASHLVSGDASKAGALKEARGFYSRKMKADEIDRLISNAELSDSGMERGLRSEFKSLAKNQRRLRMFTKEEQAAIRKAAKGGPTQFLLRQFGKFSSGPFGLTVGSGLGFAAGGPVGAAVIPPAAALARYGAGRMTMRNAQAAQELMRRGPQQAAPAAVAPPAPTPAPAAGLLGSQANSEAVRRQQLMQMLGLLNQ